MTMDTSGLRFRKPEPLDRVRRRKRRRESDVVKAIRPLVVVRDGYCRVAARPFAICGTCGSVAPVGSLGCFVGALVPYCGACADAAGGSPPMTLMDVRDWPFGQCDGPSEWAHFDALKRARTRGRPPEERHTTAGSLMLCRRHHDAYDDGDLLIDALTSDGCDGLLRYALERVVYVEVAA